MILLHRWFILRWVGRRLQSKCRVLMNTPPYELMFESITEGQCPTE